MHVKLKRSVKNGAWWKNQPRASSNQSFICFWEFHCCLCAQKWCLSGVTDTTNTMHDARQTEQSDDSVEFQGSFQKVTSQLNSLSVLSFRNGALALIPLLLLFFHQSLISPWCKFQFAGKHNWISIINCCGLTAIMISTQPERHCSVLPPSSPSPSLQLTTEFVRIGAQTETSDCEWKYRMIIIVDASRTIYVCIS